MTNDTLNEVLPEPPPQAPFVPNVPEPPKASPLPTESIRSSMDEPSTVVPPREPSRPGTVQKPKRTSGIILSIIAILLLTLPVAIYYLSQKGNLADIRNRATGGQAYPCSRNEDCTNGYTCVDFTCQGNPETQSCGRNNDMGAPVCCTDPSCSGGEKVCEPPNRLECKKNGVWCTIDTNGCTDKPTQPHTQNTSTPTSPTSPICQNIKIYKGTDQVTDFTTIHAGDVITVAVKGNLSPSKAHFRVNGGTWNETTTQNASSEFTWDYTIPDGVTQFVIEGEVFTNGAWH